MNSQLGESSEVNSEQLNCTIKCTWIIGVSHISSYSGTFKFKNWKILAKFTILTHANFEFCQKLRNLKIMLAVHWIQHRIEIRGNYHCAMKRKWSDLRTGLLILLVILLAHHLTTKRVSDMQISYKEIFFLLLILQARKFNFTLLSNFESYHLNLNLWQQKNQIQEVCMYLHSRTIF